MLNPKSKIQNPFLDEQASGFNDIILEVLKIEEDFALTNMPRKIWVSK